MIDRWEGAFAITKCGSLAEPGGPLFARGWGLAIRRHHGMGKHAEEGPSQGDGESESHPDLLGYGEETIFRVSRRVACS